MRLCLIAKDVWEKQQQEQAEPSQVPTKHRIRLRGIVIQFSRTNSSSKSEEPGRIAVPVHYRLAIDELSLLVLLFRRVHHSAGSMSSILTPKQACKLPRADATR